MTRHDKRMTPAEARVEAGYVPTTAEVLAGLAAMVRAKRKATSQSVRAVGAEIGIPWSCVYRAERRIGEPAVTTFMALLRWLETPGWDAAEFALYAVGYAAAEAEQ